MPEKEKKDKNRKSQPQTAAYIETKEQTSAPAADAIPPKPKGSIRNKIIVFLLIAAFCVFAVWRISEARKVEEPIAEQPVHVTTAQARLDSIRVSTTLTGKVEASDSAIVMAAGTSKITNVAVAVGDYVKKGARLFTLDTNAISDAAVDQAQVGVEMAEEQLAVARTNLERAQVLYENEIYTFIQLEQAQNAVTSAELGIKQAQAAVTAAEAQISDSRSQISKASYFSAPISGYVTEVNVQVGAYPNQASPAVVIYDTDHLEINASVSEYLVGQLHEGMPASFVINALGATVYEGELTTIAKAPSTSGLMYPITITVPATEANLMPGMFAEVTLVSQQAEDVLCIPSQAVIMRAGERMVVVLNGEIPSLRSVTTGLDDGETVEITSGLNVGETVITRGQYYITEGQPVVIVTE